MAWGGQRPRAGWVALGRPGIRRLVVAFAAFEGADYALAAVAAIALYAQSGALAVGLVGFRFVPAAAGALLTAPLAERLPRARVLTATTLLRAGLTALTAVALAARAPVAVVVALVWADAIAGSAYRPAQAALLPSLARSPLELTSAVALVSNAKTSSQALGALAGGVLVAAGPAWAAALAATALHLVAAAATAGLPAERRSRRAGTRPGRTHGGPAAAAITTLDAAPPGRPPHPPPRGLARLRAGAVLLAADREAAVVVGCAGLRSLVRGAWLALAVVVSVRLLDLGESGFGVLMAAAGAGSLLGVPVSGLLPERRHLGPWLAGGLVLCGLPLVVAMVAGSPVAAVALMVPWGLGLALSDVGASALLNRLVGAGDIAAVTGTLEALKLLAEGAGSLLAPVLVALLGVRGAGVAAGLLAPLVVAAAWPALGRVDARAVGRSELLDLVHGVPWFRPLGLDRLEGVVARLRREPVAPDTVVVREGEPHADAWFLVEGGELDVELVGHRVDHLARGDAFGELALLRDAPRAATVRSRTAATLLRLARADFLTAVAGPDALEAVVAAGAPAATARDLLAAVPLLRRCEPAGLDGLAAAAGRRDVAAGETIVRAGDRDDALLVLVAGRAEVVRDGRRRRELLPGDAFGEVAALHGVPRTATVVALEPCEVLSVPGARVRAAVPATPAVER